MPCETWRSQLDAYLDGELASPEAASLSSHLRGCPACATEALSRVQLKRSVAVAGKRYQPSAEFRSRIARAAGARPPRRASWQWSILAVPALALLLISLGVNWYVRRDTARRQRVYSELADLHVSALASASPVDVVSTDRHTVKPWFQGRIPFSFNLPDLQGTDFTLVGGRVTYLSQTPGAHLIYQLRKHEISVFIFQDRDVATAVPSGLVHAMSFNEDTWSQSGLRYFVVGDVNAQDIQALSRLLKNAG